MQDGLAPVVQVHLVRVRSELVDHAGEGLPLDHLLAAPSRADAGRAQRALEVAHVGRVHDEDVGLAAHARPAKPVLDLREHEVGDLARRRMRDDRTQVTRHARVLRHRPEGPGNGSRKRPGAPRHRFGIHAGHGSMSCTTLWMARPNECRGWYPSRRRALPMSATLYRSSPGAASRCTGFSRVPRALWTASKT